MRFCLKYPLICLVICLLSCQNNSEPSISIKKTTERDKIALDDFKNKLEILEESEIDTGKMEIIRIFRDGGGWGNIYGGDPYSITFFSDSIRSGFRIREKINSPNEKLLDSILIRKGPINRDQFLALKKQFQKTEYTHLTLTDTIGWICIDCSHFFVESWVDGRYNLVSWLNDERGHGEETPESMELECQKRRFWYLMLEYSNYNPEFIKSLGSSPNYKCW